MRRARRRSNETWALSRSPSALRPAVLARLDTDALTLPTATQWSLNVTVTGTGYGEDARSLPGAQVWVWDSSAADWVLAGEVEAPATAPASERTLRVEWTDADLQMLLDGGVLDVLMVADHYGSFQGASRLVLESIDLTGIE